MLFDRRYEPTDSEIIYHYCTAEAFLAICSNKKLRFSDVFSMNDFLEMHWGYSIWESARGELLDIVDQEFLKQIDLILHTSGLIATPLASCFSLDGDVLSQWRAYTGDGEGYAIGFQANLMTQLAVRPLKVLYDKKEQINEVKSVIRAMYAVESERAKKDSREFYDACLHFLLDLAALKNPAFKEEQEVRLLHALEFEESNSSLRLADPGGIAFGANVAQEPVSFRMRNNVPVAFIDIDFTNHGQVNPVREVVVGPKNNARLSGVSVFLETAGLPSVNVKRSNAPYR